MGHIPEIETRSKDEIIVCQNGRLNEFLGYINAKS